MKEEKANWEHLIATLRTRAGSGQAQARIKGYGILGYKIKGDGILGDGMKGNGAGGALFNDRQVDDLQGSSDESPDDGENDRKKQDGIGVPPTTAQEPYTGLLAKTKVKVAEPKLYKVLMLNDDYTPMEFVVHALQAYFDKTLEEATQIMLSVHTQGVGICGVFTRDVADTKCQMVTELARSNGHPLMCQIEQA